MKSLTQFILAAVLLTTLAGCDVEQTQEGEMPNVDVEGGQVPKYDVDTPDVDVGTEKREVTMPTVDIDMPDDEE